MTSKEEAQNLVDKYSNGIYFESHFQSKQCALLDNRSTHIAIQRFLLSVSVHLTGEQANKLAKEQLEKYRAIAEEIEKL